MPMPTSKSASNRQLALERLQRVGMSTPPPPRAGVLGIVDRATPRQAYIASPIELVERCPAGERYVTASMK